MHTSNDDIPECTRLMNGLKALDILDWRSIGWLEHHSDILMASPRKTMGPGGGGAPLSWCNWCTYTMVHRTIASLWEQCIEVHLVHFLILLTNKGKNWPFFGDLKYITLSKLFFAKFSTWLSIFQLASERQCFIMMHLLFRLMSCTNGACVAQT